MLLARAEVADFADDGGEEVTGAKLAMAAKHFDEAVFAELFVGAVEGFRDSVGVEGERIAGAHLDFGNGAIPLFEDAEDCSSGFEALE